MSKISKAGQLQRFDSRRLDLRNKFLSFSMRIQVLAAILSMGLIAVAAAQERRDPGWIADARTGCRVWNASPQPNETIRWEGPCVAGLAHGRGVLQWYENDRPTERSEGEYREGRQNGHATVTFSNGNRYDGEWLDGRRHGRGVLTWANGDRYEGEWRDNKRDGRGISMYSSGDRYEGEWRDDLPNGFGNYYNSTINRASSGIWHDGCFREGDYKAAINRDLSECP
jgi:hypothetical protein